MKPAKKVTIIVAAALIVVGFMISLGALNSMGFDFKKLNTVNYETNTYMIDEAFTNISVESDACDVRLLLSDDGSCKVICNESDEVSHSVTVQNHTLLIDSKDKRKWYEHIGFYFGNYGKMEVEIYLPQSEYESLYILGISGDIIVPDDFSFSDAKIRNTSGDVSFQGSVKNDLSVKTVSGDLYVKDANPKNLDVKSTSGTIQLTDIECQKASSETTSGEIIFSNLIASENIYIESVSGDVQLYVSDSNYLWIKTVSGDVSGSLLSEKIFKTETISGDIRVPKTTGEGECEIKTTSGDVDITYNLKYNDGID